MKKIIILIACLIAFVNAECRKDWDTYHDFKIHFQGDAEQQLKSMTSISKWLNLKEYYLDAEFIETDFTVGTSAGKSSITGVRLTNSSKISIEIDWATNTEWHHGKGVTTHYSDKSVIRFYDEFGIEDHVQVVYYDMPKTLYKKLCRNK